jgi:hypothetical protein
MPGHASPDRLYPGSPGPPPAAPGHVNSLGPGTGTRCRAPLRPRCEPRPLRLAGSATASPRCPSPILPSTPRASLRRVVPHAGAGTDPWSSAPGHRPADTPKWSHDWQNRWSHAPGRTQLTAVPSRWQATRPSAEPLFGWVLELTLPAPPASPTTRGSVMVSAWTQRRPRATVPGLQESPARVVPGPLAADSGATACPGVRPSWPQTPPRIGSPAPLGQPGVPAVPPDHPRKPARALGR